MMLEPLISTSFLLVIAVSGFYVGELIKSFDFLGFRDSKKTDTSSNLISFAPSVVSLESDIVTFGFIPLFPFIVAFCL
jgi:hypothetical protein